MLSSFQTFNIIQFLAAVNENLYRMLVAFFLIVLLGDGSASLAMASTGFLFLLPFLLFSTLGGLLADKYSKKRIVIVTRAFECILFMFAIVAMALQSQIGSYVVLFLLASVSAIFGPAKYSLIPELYSKERLIRANSIIAGFTFFGIIFGTGLASLLIQVSGYRFYTALIMALTLALTAFVLSLSLPHTKARDPAKKIPLFFYKELAISLIEMGQFPKLLSATVAYGYFLFIGAFVQLNIVPFSIEVLGLSIISGGYLFILAAIGIALGAFVTDKICPKKNNLLLTPYAGFAISFFMILLALIPSMFWLLILGFFGGIFLVPVQTHILATSPIENRGRNFSSANLLSFFFAVLASGALYLLNTMLSLTPHVSYIVIGLFNALVSFFFLWAFWEQPCIRTP